ncbi:MAG TPA: DUF559 domain-containing protein [Acidimicrobiales bacterium]|nr:DUF559 domain-containing protein [Acidimicrobiales bacterium]
MGELELAELASRQDGLVARPQARDHLSKKQLEGRLASGRLVVVRRGVYRFAGVPPGPRADLRAVCLAVGAGAVVSHRSAAELWDLRGVVADRPEITVPAPMWPRLPGVRCHQSGRLLAAHFTTRSGFPVTTPPRTLADLAFDLSPRFLGSLVDQCLRRRIARISELRAVHDELLGRVGGLAALRSVLDAREGRYDPGESAGEVETAELLVGAGLPRPVPQHQVIAGGTVYVLDLAYPDRRLGIEYDGWEVHASRSAFEHDRERDNALAAAGWTILRYTAGMSAEGLVAAARAAYGAADRENTPSKGQLREYAPV